MNARFFLTRCRWLTAGALCLIAARTSLAQTGAPIDKVLYNVRAFGAVGDGKPLASPAVNRAIEACAQAGGGTVYFPAGTYASWSIHLMSNVALYIHRCGTILAG